MTHTHTHGRYTVTHCIRRTPNLIITRFRYVAHFIAFYNAVTGGYCVGRNASHSMHTLIYRAHYTAFRYNANRSVINGAFDYKQLKLKEQQRMQKSARPTGYARLYSDIAAYNCDFIVRAFI